ncbi:MAG: hypothetical protein KAH93_02710 [Candidatus Aenigmarchaeota archaeon]|nr:hypothetical protein [Candidatus Aenigmarchaeota archaeon]
MVVISSGFVDKLKMTFHKRSIDQEIDEAFDDSNAYSKKVLEGSSGQLSSAYRQEAQPKPQPALVEPGAAQDQDPFADKGAVSISQMPELTDPLVLPRAMDREPPRRDEPLLMPTDHVSTNDERKEFFEQVSPVGDRSGVSSSDVSRILLEIKDLRTQNEHILDILKNMQDRMRGY